MYMYSYIVYACIMFYVDMRMFVGVLDLFFVRSLHLNAVACMHACRPIH